MADYSMIFFIALAVNAVVTFRSSALWSKFCGSSAKEEETNTELAKAHKSLLRKYLIVYLLATLSDWLQGPYVYALYDAYGYSQHDIAVLFVAGFGSSMVFGSFIGGMADWGGRRRFVVIFAITYAASCITKHFKNFWVLMLGRLLGGVATSLLFSVFETWLIRSHADRKLGKEFLSSSFSYAAYGNSVIAILAGLVANKAASFTTMEPVQGELVYVGGYLNPFDIALVALVICGIACASMWEENYGEDGPRNEREEEKGGDDGHTAAWYDGLKNAFIATIRSRDILLCGIISSLFEGSMYIFVFMWTPALTQLGSTGEKVQLPFGLIFSTFMVSCMAGSSLFSILIAKVKGEAMAVGVFVVAASAMALVAFGTTDTVCFTGMLLFEAMVGMYFPVMGTMKGAIVPEDKRAAIYNLFRIPLNFIVLFSLLTDLTPTISFTLNATMLATAAILQAILMTRRLNMNNMQDVKEKSQHQVSEPTSTETAPLTKDQDVV
mmetsp:Transcript_23011/g.38034  ORF Transcript_23011/g.38034 Transcript_23011/m.38034 type:complete len:495 (-) Transcript_23011:120-1604(-)|eukprot:CAMPEP_0119015682 /NCGR_PEP_ID=MMETSP1176-20130426/11401_1 /TAXON_ID=265551 /ORGANISM="Synedropsis recta cf, Strain CCMP1620" /LENGTH=494 /DNA_ID=CAMNT_0006968995 /DNA_START=97 /DNA_END=1581 /DNA_ORIENTATION=+